LGRKGLRIWEGLNLGTVEMGLPLGSKILAWFILEVGLMLDLENVVLTGGIGLSLKLGLKDLIG
jgi:hypothetical protein